MTGSQAFSKILSCRHSKINTTYTSKSSIGACLVNDEIPAWAIDLIKQIERLNEKIPTHVDWVERNIKDHEMRLRMLERRMWIIAGAATIIGAVGTMIWQVM